MKELTTLPPMATLRLNVNLSFLEAMMVAVYSAALPTMGIRMKLKNSFKILSLANPLIDSRSHSAVTPMSTLTTSRRVMAIRVDSSGFVSPLSSSGCCSASLLRGYLTVSGLGWALLSHKLL